MERAGRPAVRGASRCAPVAQLIHHLLLHVWPLVLVHLAVERDEGLAVLVLVLRLDQLPPLLHLHRLDHRVLVPRLPRRRRHTDEDQFLRAHLVRPLPRDVAAPVLLDQHRRVLGLALLLLLLHQPAVAVLLRADVLHELGALPPLPAALVELHRPDRRLERHQRVVARVLPLLLVGEPRLQQQHVEQLLALRQRVRLVLDEEARHRHLEHLGRELEVDEHVVEVDRRHAAVQLDQQLLRLEHAADHRVERLLDVHPLLRVHQLVVRLLELAEDLEVPDVQRGVVLERLLLPDALLHLGVGVGVEHLELVEELDHALLPLLARGRAAV